MTQRFREERLLNEAIPKRRATPALDGSPIPDEVLLMILRAGLEEPRRLVGCVDLVVLATRAGRSRVSNSSCIFKQASKSGSASVSRRSSWLLASTESHLDKLRYIACLPNVTIA